MSRYVQVQLDIEQIDDLVAGLNALGLAFERAEADGALMLEGSLECAGEPVALRLAAGVCGAVEDFGFVRSDGARWLLVCGEHDRARLSAQLLAPLRAAATVHRVQRMATREGLALEQHVEPDGTRRLVLKRE